MARIGRDDRITPSLLDRLIDTEPDVSTEPEFKQFQDVRAYEASVLRDVENLLNTRRGIDGIPEGCEELQQSAITYGLPDFTSSGVGSQEERDVLRRAVESAIRLFEPRLTRVRVTVHPLDDATARAIRMSVDAVLLMDPDPIPIAFDTLVEPASGSCKVEGK